jgi:hypothetical protein
MVALADHVDAVRSVDTLRAFARMADGEDRHATCASDFGIWQANYLAMSCAARLRDELALAGRLCRASCTRGRSRALARPLGTTGIAGKRCCWSSTASAIWSGARLRHRRRSTARRVRDGRGRDHRNAAYMSPSRLGQRVDPRSDLYSLGIMLFEMASGRVPRAPSSRRCWSRATLPPPPLSELAPD